MSIHVAGGAAANEPAASRFADSNRHPADTSLPKPPSVPRLADELFDLVKRGNLRPEEVPTYSIVAPEEDLIRTYGTDEENLIRGLNRGGSPPTENRPGAFLLIEITDPMNSEFLTALQTGHYKLVLYYPRYAEVVTVGRGTRQASRLTEQALTEGKTLQRRGHGDRRAGRFAVLGAMSARVDASRCPPFQAC